MLKKKKHIGYWIIPQGVFLFKVWSGLKKKFTKETSFTQLCILFLPPLPFVDLLSLLAIPFSVS